MKSKYVVAATGMIFITTVVLLSYLHFSSEKEVVHRFQAEQQLDSRQLAREIKSYLTEKTVDVNLLSSLPSFQNKDQKKIDIELQKFIGKQEDGNVKSVTVYDEKAQIIGSTIKDIVGTNNKELNLFDWASIKENNGKQFFSSLIKTQNDSRVPVVSHRLVLVSPFYYSHSVQGDKLAGVITMSIDLSSVVSRLLAEISADTTDEDTYLINSDGLVLIHTKHPEMVPMNINALDKTCFNCHVSFDHVKGILKRSNGTFEYSLKESPKKLASFSSLEVMNLSWKIVISIPYNTVSGFINKDLLLTQIVIGIIALSLIAGSYLLHRSNRLQIRAQEEAKQLVEKQRLEKEILESEKQYRTVVDNSPDAIIVHCEGKIVFVNAAAIKLVCASNQSELLGKPAIEFVHPDERALISKRILEVVKSGKSSPRLEERFVNLNGGIINVEVVSTPINYGGKPSLQVIVHDITERKRAELERQVMYEITHGITTSGNLDELLKLIHQTLGKMLYAENFFVALHDQKKGLFSFPYFVDKFDPVPSPASLGKSCTSYVFRTKEPLLLTPELFTKLNKKGEVELVGSASPSWVGIPLQTPSRIIGVLVLQHYEEENVYTEGDIKFLNTVASQIAVVIERKYAEDELKEKEERMRLIVEGTPYLFFYTQDTSGSVIYTSPSVEKITGYSNEKWRNQSHWFITDNKINELAKEKTHAHLRGEVTQGPIIVEIEHADKYPILLEVYESPIIRDGYVVGIQGVAHDITNRERAQEKLRNERLLLRTVIDNIPDSIYSKDTNFRKTLANPTELQYVGANAETEILGKTDFDFYPEDIAKRFFADDQLVIQSGLPILNREEYFYDKDGQKQWLLTSKLPLKDDKGNIIGIVGIGRNITNSKQSEEALRESEIKFRSYVENAPDGIFITNTDGFYLDVNSSGCRLLGYSKEELLNMNASQIVISKEIEKAKESLNEIHTEGGYSNEFTFLRKDGTTFNGLLDAVKISETKFLGFVKDVTERKRAEIALRESEVKLNVILESTADGILAIDDKGKIIKTNWRFLDLWHIPNSLLSSEDDNALLNFAMDQLINPEDFISKVKKLYRSKEEDLDMLYFKDGRTFERFSAPLIMSDSSVGRVWSFRDITDRKLAEEEIKKRNEELLKTNTEKNKFFSIIAHDLKSPFQGFISLTEIMARDIKSFTLDELSVLSKEMNKTAGNLFKLLVNLLEWAQMQKGIMKFLPQDYLLTEIVNECAEAITQIAAKKEIQIVKTVPDRISLRVDEKMVNSVLRNLLSNAVKFTDKGGKIIVEAKEIENEVVQISVSDSGIGMSEDLCKKLFKMEEKVGRKGTEGEESTGLGLLLCKEFVERHGGQIWAESEVGKGSTFYFTLPKNQ